MMVHALLHVGAGALISIPSPRPLPPSLP